MDLIPNNTSIESIHYNWTGWAILTRFLEKHDCSMNEFAGVNDGDRISKDTCKLVAKILREHAQEIPNISRQYISEEEAKGVKFTKEDRDDASIIKDFLEDATFWEKCNGCQQW